MKLADAVLVAPPNDPEAVMIFELAKKMRLPTIESLQPHGATLEKEPKLIEKLTNGGWKRIVIVEMPGRKTEENLRRLGFQVTIIDHHHYTDIDRAHDPNTGHLLPSSLEQFLNLLRITDAKLRVFGFDPKLVRGVGIMDRGFVWALREEGYQDDEIKRVLAYQKKLMGKRLNARLEARKDALARKAWKRRTVWNGYTLVVDESSTELRPRLSLIIALEVKRPLPLIVVEKKRGLLYVQETPHAMALFKKFGGFTFGMDRNWGYKNERGKTPVTLQDVQRFLVTR
jgi:hypothetical protein